MGRSKNLLRVALAVCDARCTPVQLRFSTTIAAARDGFSRSPYATATRMFQVEGIRNIAICRIIFYAFQGSPD
jgi:hypothetical protein